MPIVKPVRLLGAVTALVTAPMLVALAQTPQQTLPQPPPSATTQEAQPGSAPKPSMDRPAPERSAAPAPERSAAKPNSLIGRTVLSSDGNRLGTVRGVNTAADGKVMAIKVKTGGFLGFGGKLVAIPQEKFTTTGDVIQAGLTADEVSKLPEVKDQS
jgi:hypothetical protein